MSNTDQHVVVIGGGIIGAMSAYYLARAGCRVTIVESGGFGRGCSHGNCGLVSPSHVLPLSQPGAVSKALKAMMGSRSPFYIKPRFDPTLWMWLLRFARRCNERDMLHAGGARAALLNSSMQLYLQLIDEETINCEWEHRGCLFVYLTERGLDSYAAVDEMQRKHFGISATRYDGDAVRDLEPALTDGLAGGWHYECDAHMRPDKLMNELKRVLNKHHVTIHENTRFHHFKRDKATGRAAAIYVDSGANSTGYDIPADAFVLATGAVAPKWQEELGVKLRIQPGKGYSMTMPRPQRCPKIPMIFQEHKVAVTPMQSGYRLGSTMEFSGYDMEINKRRLQLLTDGAQHYLDEPTATPVEETWCGWRPMTPDGIPIVGPAPAMPNITIATGHSMLGMSMGPATGKLVAELITDQPTHIDAKVYGPRNRT